VNVNIQPFLLLLYKHKRPHAATWFSVYIDSTSIS